MSRVCCLVMLMCGLGISTGKAADSYSTVISNHLALETGTAIDAENPADSTHVADLKRAVVTETETLPQGPKIAPPPATSHSAEVMAVVLPLVALLALGLIGYLAKRRLDSMALARALTEKRSAALVAEDPAVSGFFIGLREALNPDPHETAEAPAKEVQPRTREEGLLPAPDPLQDFLASAPAQIAGLRKVFSEISRATDDAARQTILVDFQQKVSSMKASSRMPEVRPVWLVASALEGLLKQLSNNLTEFTASVLGTAAGAVDLLEVLTVSGVNPDLATEPPVRLLAVDDDPVSRLAVSFALKKAFNAPDLAPDGPAALDLVARQTYDVIFLDVDMPGMDGYELCTRIHRTEGHQTTPVVFVTRHGDFQSRAISKLSGGEDLIAKPFLAFEITVKALTLALRGRLQTREVGVGLRSTSQAVQPAIATTAPELTTIAPELTTIAPELTTIAPELTTIAPELATTATELAAVVSPAARTAEQIGTENQLETDASASPANGTPSWELSDRGFQTLLSTSRDDSTNAFFKQAPVFLKRLRQQLQAVIAKPFRAFQITVKALTSALRGRLQNREVGVELRSTSQAAQPAIATTAPELATTVSEIVSTAPELAAPTREIVTTASELATIISPAARTAEQNGSENQSEKDTPASTVNGTTSWELSDRGFQALFSTSRDETPNAFFKQAPVFLERLRQELVAVQRLTKPADVQDILVRLCGGVHSFTLEAERAELRTVSRFSSALEGMLKKMSGQTKLCTPSTFTAADAALELLEELCGHNVAQPDLSQPVRILVVDDDPVARRAISMSVQLVFGRPVNAESGEGAVAQATKMPFDLILLDVLMPGIDGFATCKRIHQTDLNCRTPVVFITSHDDTDSRSKAVAAGGCGFIPKPVLPSQITLTALTFILRARLNPSAQKPSLEELAAKLQKVNDRKRGSSRVPRPGVSISFR